MTDNHNADAAAYLQAGYTPHDDEAMPLIANDAVYLVDEIQTSSGYWIKFGTGGCVQGWFDPPQEARVHQDEKWIGVKFENHDAVVLLPEYWVTRDYYDLDED